MPTGLKLLRPRVAMLTSRVATLEPGSWRAGKTTSERGYGYQWEKARDAYLRLHPVCVMCQERGIYEPSTVVDHKIPHRGDMTLFWDRLNWQALCVTHHNRDKQRIEQDAMGPELP